MSTLSGNKEKGGIRKISTLKIFQGGSDEG